MSKKDKQNDPKIGEKESLKEENKKEEEKKVEPFRYGIAPRLAVSLVREDRVYRFEMPIGAHLAECQEACSECFNIVRRMKEEAEIKAATDKKEKEKKDNQEKESLKDEK